MNKIAFYIADKRHFDYFGNVIQEVKKLGGDIILVINDTRNIYGSGEVEMNYSDEMAALAKERGMPFILSRDAIVSGIFFRLIVSTFSYTYKVPFGKKILRRRFVRWLSRKLGQPFKKILPSSLSERISTYASDNYIVNRWEYPEQLLAKEAVFFPKGLDINDDFPNQIVCEIADHYFCHGRYDHKIMEKNIGKEIFEIGYPRYDRLKNTDSVSSVDLIEEFSMDRSKPLICWVPTYFPDKRNIMDWISHFESLTDSYNLLVRPHPKQIERDDGSLLHLLNEKGFYTDLKDDREMTSLYAESWMVCCDYGGTIFSAIYTGANLLLLNVKDHHMIEEKRNRSADILVRNRLLNLTPEEVLQWGGVRQIILDLELRKKQSEQMELVRRDYFGDIKLGEGSTLTAKKLLSLLS
jgi:hypothetical protein